MTSSQGCACPVPLQLKRMPGTGCPLAAVRQQPGKAGLAIGRLVVSRLPGNELAGPAAGGWLFGIAAGLSCARLTRRIGAQRLLAASAATMAASQLGLTSNVLISAGALATAAGIHAPILAGVIPLLIAAALFLRSAR